MEYKYFVVYTFGASGYSRPGRRVVTLKNEIMTADGINEVESKIKEELQKDGYCFEWFVIVNFELLCQVGDDGKPADWDYVMVHRDIHEALVAENKQLKKDHDGFSVVIERAEKDSGLFFPYIVLKDGTRKHCMLGHVSHYSGGQTAEEAKKWFDGEVARFEDKKKD